MKKRLITLAIVVLFVLTMVPFAAPASAAGFELERVDLRPIDPDAAANNNDSTQMGWATEGFEDEDTPMDVEAAVAFRAVYLALEMPEMPDYMQFILQTPAGWWQEVAYEEDALSALWDDGVLRLPFKGTDGWDPGDFRAKFLIAFYADGVMDLGITDQWLEVYPAVEEGELVELRPLDPDSAANNNEQQIGWATEGFEDEDTPMDIPAALASRATHLVLEMPEAPGFLQFIFQSPAGWWQQFEYEADELAGFWDDDSGTLNIPFTGDWDPADLRAKFLVAFYDDTPLDLGITGQWLLIGPEVELEPPPPPREWPPEGTLPFNLGLGGPLWGIPHSQLGWNGDERAGNDPFDGGGLTAGLLAQADYFVIYVDNAPDDYAAEMLTLMIFGNANGWDWSGGIMEAPTVQIYDTFVPGAIAFPIGGHPYLEAIRAAGEDELDNRNFGIMFEYGEEDGPGLESLGITSVWLYRTEDIPTAGPAEPEAPAEPDEPEDTAPVAPAPESDGIPVWGWVLIAVGGAAVIVVIIVVAAKKGKKA